MSIINPANLLGFGVAITLLFLPAKMLAQRDADCKKFQELSRQKGLSLSTELSDPNLYEGQWIVPDLVVENKSNQYIEIPDYSKSTGVFVTTVAYEYLQPFGPFRNSRYEVEGCSIRTILMVPGETRRFTIQVDATELQAPEFSKEESNNTSRIPTAEKANGQGYYYLVLGRSALLGTYRSIRPEIEDLACFTKPIPPDVRPKIIGYQDGEDLCQLAMIIRKGTERLLVSSPSPLTMRMFSTVLHKIDRSKSNPSFMGSFPGPTTPLLALPEQAVFIGTQPRKPQRIQDLSIALSGGRKISFKDLPAEVASQKASLRKR